MKKNLTKNISFYKYYRCCFLFAAFFLFLISLFPAMLIGTAAARAATEIELPETSYGIENSAFKILVAYATRAGSTIGVAQAIGKKLAESGAAVDVKPVKNVKDIRNYQAVVIGSAIRRGSVLPEIPVFIQDNKEELKNIPVALFIVCMVLREDNEQNRAKAASYIKSLQDEISFVDIGFFTGKLDYAPLNFIDAFIIKYFIGTPEGDLRDWQKIDEWAYTLGAKLKSN